MGRKPKPRGLKVLYGNQGKRPLPENEPRPEAVMPDCPDFVQGESREQWHKLGPMLLSLGVLTEMDAPALALLVSPLGRWVVAESRIEVTGGPVLIGPEGGLYQNPHLSVANKAWDQAVKLLAEFGMTPSSRAKVMVSKASRKPTDFESDTQQYA